MTLVVEDGSGVDGAESYASVSDITAYWQGRPGDLATAWDGAAVEAREGAARVAAQYVDAVYGPHYTGYVKSPSQPLLWPRVEGLDEDGNTIPLKDALGRELPSLPAALIHAQAELAARALSGPLAGDQERGGRVRRTSEQVGPIQESVEYFDGAQSETKYGVAEGILAPVLDGSQPGASRPTWVWF